MENLWPEPTPGDLLLLEMEDDDFNAVMWVGLGDWVAFDGEYAHHEGVIIDIDYAADRVLVEVSPRYQFWVDVARVTVLFEAVETTAVAIAS